MLREFKARNISSKSSIHQAWDEEMAWRIRDLVGKTGWEIIEDHWAKERRSSCLWMAIDSSGFELEQGSSWRLLKWKKAYLRKPSKYYNKVHLLAEVRSQAVLSLSITESFDSDISQLLKVLRRGKVLRHGKGNERCFMVYGDKAYYGGKLIAKLEGWGVRLVVEPKKNLKERGGDSLSERSLRLYRRSLGLWRHTLKYYLKAQVEHVFGVMKQKPFRTRDKKPRNQYKHFTTLFLLHNLEILVRGGENMKK